MLFAQNTEEYIAEHSLKAQFLMQNYGLPASLILAVAIHESAAGKSKIARYLNNHFGIKGQNSNKEIKSSYKDYPSVDSSYVHFVNFLLSRSYFAALFDKFHPYDYRAWAYGIQKAGYAGSRTWASQVIAIIKKYDLDQLDSRPPNLEIEDTISSVSTPRQVKANVKKATYFYLVKAGDNLGSIAKKLNTTVSNLMKKNKLSSTNLKIGQKIKP